MNKNLEILMLQSMGDSVSANTFRVDLQMVRQGDWENFLKCKCHKLAVFEGITEELTEAQHTPGKY